ncbi:pitrilysin family protein, partial [Georgenia sp. 10Sc9-8]|nr:pitrilysin family protein [Georgenia halotolerans]
MPRPLILGPAAGPGTELHLEQDGSVIRRSVLPGGIRVLTEAMPGQRSTAVGAWVAVGSRDETDGHHGSTHFLEHLLFKGTARRSALDIAQEFDAVGGEANAATGKEHTCYYARVLDADLPMAVDVITDMVTSALLDAAELETERGVILEELAMNDDDPVDVAHERFTTAVLGDHPLGRPIGGTPDTIRAVPREAVLAHYRRTYVPAELVVTAAGSVDHDTLCDQVLEAVRAGGWQLDPGAAPALRRGQGPVPPAVAEGGAPPALPRDGQAVTVTRPTEQAHVLLGGPGLTAADERRFTLSVLTTVLGGGMSSRLFQEVRERRG